ncbi:MAG: carbohydrate ABC transporter permease [Candidatus Oleimicrobiaceae bacterium]
MWAPFLFIAPSALLLLSFFFIPIAAAFLMSFSDLNLYSLGDWRRISFVGFGNYGALLRDGLFWRAMANTFYFVLVGGPLTVVVSLCAALTLNSRLVRCRSLFRLGFFMPVVTTLVAVAVIWRWLYHPRFGLINYLLSLVGVRGPDWLASTTWAMPALILMAVWKNFGYNMIIFLAGLQTIAPSYYEAARIDGASGWQSTLYITLPLLAPTTLFVSIVTTIGYLQFFAEPYIMTQGGPLDSTLSVVLLMYQEAFKFWNMGYAAAIAFTLFAVIFVLTMLQVRLQRRHL